MARSRLTIKQRREMGLTIRNIGSILKELKEQEGFLDQPTEDQAIELLDVLVRQNPTAFQDPKIDWDAIIAFIEKLIPLILKIIEMFSVFF